MGLGLQSRSDRDQLGSVAHQLTQFAGLRWSDPRLGQPAHPQQIGQISGVAYVVLHAPITESLDTQRMSQMHTRSASLQHINRPVPPVRRFQHHLGVGSGLLELQCQRDRIVEDPHRRQLLTLTTSKAGPRPKASVTRASSNESTNQTSRAS